MLKAAYLQSEDWSFAAFLHKKNSLLLCNLLLLEEILSNEKDYKRYYYEIYQRTDERAPAEDNGPERELCCLPGASWNERRYKRHYDVGYKGLHKSSYRSAHDEGDGQRNNLVFYQKVLKFIN